MAEISLCAMDRRGPPIPSELGVVLRDRDWQDGGRTPVLVLFVGTDTVEIWPADPDRIKQLAAKLNQLADKLTRTGEGPHS